MNGCQCIYFTGDKNMEQGMEQGMEQKRIIAFLLTGFFIFASYGLCNAYTPPATYDPSGSERGEYQINCDFSREYYSLINPFSVILYDSKCGKKKPVVHPDPSPYPDDDVDTDWDGDEWQPDDTPDVYPNQQYNRELKEWSDITANKVLVDLVNRHRRGEFVNYLTPDMLDDMAFNGYQFQVPMEECLSRHIANDVDNVGNYIRSNRDVAGYLAGTVRDCYIRIRNHNNQWQVY